jgi:hypothetical protein
MTYKKWMRFLPSLEISIKIPFLTVKTTLFRELVEANQYDWYGLDIIFFKWHFRFHLYALPIRW